jgi:hypothetical protein
MKQIKFIIKLFIHSEDLKAKSHIYMHISEAFLERNNRNTPPRNTACTGQVGQPHVKPYQNLQVYDKVIIELKTERTS